MWEWLKVTQLGPLASRIVPTLSDRPVEAKGVAWRAKKTIVTIVIGYASPTCPTKPGSLAAFFLKIGIPSQSGTSRNDPACRRLELDHGPL